MKRFPFIFLLILVPAILSAQQKKFTFSEIFEGEFPAVFKDLPEIQGWADDDHYIELTNNNGSSVAMSVNVVTGAATPYNAPKETQEPAIEDGNNATLSPDGKLVAFTRKNNLFIKELASGKETALTSDGSEVILNGYASWIYYEEILGRSSHYKAFWWSPDSRHISYMRFDDSQVPVFPIYFADGQHGLLETQRYPKAGDKNPTVRVGIVDITNGKTTWADFNESHEQYFGTPYWTNNNELFVQWMNREQDSLVVFRVDKKNGEKTTIYTETQSTWITLDDDKRFRFLKSNKAFIIKSDKDGWENLYLYDMNGKFINPITTGNFWGTEILHLDEKSNTLYFHARKDHSARFDVYKTSLSGKNITRLTSGDYSYDAVNFSPNGKYFFTTYSNLSTPPSMAIIDRNGKLTKNLGNSKTNDFDKYAIAKSALVKVKSGDGVFDLPMVITYPVDFDSTKKYPVWITVYGGPNSGTVYDRWKPSGGLTQWWAQEGVIQVAMDNRSSGHFGRKGMNYIYKQLGKWETEDYMTCAKWLAKQKWVDSSKIGINGGSFGGYITCMALTYGADVFTHGIANYSVTDWQLYDSHYTERFMKTPQTNAGGYKSTSVLTHVNKYKGLLRIVHGTTDDNVHMQNSIQLINELQEKRKHFELMLYPNQRHGIGGGKATHNMLETIRFVYLNMLEKPLPAEFGKGKEGGER